MNKFLSLVTGKPNAPSGNALERVMDTLRPAATAVRPAVLRIGVGAFAAVHNYRRREMFQKLHRQDASRFAPVGVVRILKKPLPPKVADALFEAAQVANILTTLGIAHRVTGPLNAALQLWTVTYRNSWGMIFHNHNGVIAHQAVLGFAPAADALSVDALLRHGRLVPNRVGHDRFDRRYGGVATAMNIATTVVYFISGIAKVRSPKGWAWASGDTLRDQIGSDAVRKEVFGSDAPKMAGALYNSKAQFGLLAVITLIVELGAPLSLAHRRLGQLFAVSAWAMHVGIRIVMGIKFRYNLTGVSYLSYFPVGPQLPR
ncbi:MAG: hypothetical protein ACTHXA_03375 [Gulosibacter sp.]|uniref:hypothetical protein n=1 Tax=Gulosibacter sp. TaxID=2817531 RepID=UPI003F8EBBF1